MQNDAGKKTSPKNFRPTTLALFGQENKKSKFHNVLHGDVNDSDKLLNQRQLYNELPF